MIKGTKTLEVTGPAQLHTKPESNYRNIPVVKVLRLAVVFRWGSFKEITTSIGPEPGLKAEVTAADA